MQAEKQKARPDASEFRAGLAAEQQGDQTYQRLAFKDAAGHYGTAQGLFAKATTPLPTPPRAPAADPRAEIRTVLDAYKKAIEGKDLTLFQQVRPNLSDAELRRVRARSSRAKSQMVDLRIESIEVSGDEAQAKAAAGRVRPKEGREVRNEAPFVFKLKRTGSGWVIRRSTDRSISGRSTKRRARMSRSSGFAGFGLGGVLALVTLMGATLVAAPPVGAQDGGRSSSLPDDTLRETRRAIFSGLATRSAPCRTRPAAGSSSGSTRASASSRGGPTASARSSPTGRRPPAGKLTLTTSYSRHTFDELDGVDLRNGDLQGIIGVALFNPGFVAARFGLISIREEVEADVFTLGGLYGVTDQIDVGLTLPIVRAKVKERVRLTATADCVPAGADVVCGNVQPANVEEVHSAEQTGIGDLVLRGKYNFWQAQDLAGGRAGLTFALDVKLPTGDKGERSKFASPYEQFFTAGQLQLGEPRWGRDRRVRPQLVASGAWFGVAPHVNVGAELGTTEGITNDLVYEVGFDYTRSAGPPSRRTSWTPRLRRDASADHRDGRSDGTADPDTLAASFGIKVNPVGTLLVFLNFLVPLNNTGIGTT
jgi:hypothetical protein